MNASSHTLINTQRIARGVAWAVAFTALIAAPDVFAEGSGFDGTTEQVCGFFSNITSLLGMASIAVVTIAVVFAGYQIAFAHKRISDVSTILIGGLLIGAAGQIASMVIGKDGGNCSPSDVGFLIQQAVQYYGA